MPAQQWADLSATDGSFGVTVISDNKYGWDKPDDSTLRLTLVRSPKDWTLSPLRWSQHTQDLGPHVTTFALYGHAGTWQGKAWPVAARVNQPLLAFQTQRAPGEFGRQQAGIEVSNPDIALKALKRAEDGDGYVVRLVEMAGKPQTGVTFSFGTGIETAEELNGIEDLLGPAILQDGTLKTDFAPYQIRTFRIRPAEAFASLPSPESRQVTLTYNVDVASSMDAAGDGAMGKDEFDRDVAIPSEQFPDTLVDGGIEFQLGPVGEGQSNAVECRGQTIELPETKPGDRLFLLASAQGKQKCQFTVGSKAVTLEVPNFTGQIGNWVGRVHLDTPLEDSAVYLINDPAKFIPPHYTQQRLAWYTTHRHLPEGDDPYEFTYLFRFELPVPDGANQVVLPDKPECRVFAMTLSNSANTRIVAGSRMFDEFDPLAANIDFAVMNPAVEPEAPVEPNPEAAGDVLAHDVAQDDIGGKPSGSKDGGCAASAASPAPARDVGTLLMLALLASVFALVRCRRCR